MRVVIFSAAYLEVISIAWPLKLVMSVTKIQKYEYEIERGEAIIKIDDKSYSAESPRRTDVVLPPTYSAWLFK